MGLTRTALANSRLALLIVLTVTITGLWFYADFPSREDPEIAMREAVVTVEHPGMAPLRLEQLVVRRLEEAIRQMSEVEDIEVTIRPGSAIMHVHLYARYDDLEPLWQDLRSRLDDARVDLPDGTLGPFVDDDFGDVAVATIGLTGAGFDAADLRRTARDVRERLYAVEGVDRIELHGVREERIFLETTNARLAEFGLDPARLGRILQEQNVIQSGGRVEVRGREVIVEPTGHFQSLDDIRAVPLPVPGVRGLVQVRDVFEVKRGFVDPPERLAYVNGAEAVVLAVSMRSGQNVLRFGPRLAAAVEDIQASLPLGYRLDFATFQPEPVEQAIADVTTSLYQTLVIVLVVVVLFTGFRQGLIVGLMVPLAMLTTLVVMRLLDIELQRVSLASMIVSLGMLVSNFVAVAEDIRRRMGEGVPADEAATAAGNELALPLLVATLTTILAFLPPLLSQDEAGEYTRSLSLVIAIALLTSWVLALTIVPLACVRFLRPPEDRDREEREPWLARVYGGVLEFCLRLRLLVVGGLVAVLAAGAWLLASLPEQFFPESERAELMLYVDLPAGGTSVETDRRVRDLLAWFADEAVNPEVRRTAAYVGFGGPRFFLTVAPMDPAPNRAFVLVEVDDFAELEGVIERTRAHLRAEHGDVRTRITRPFLGYVETGLVELRLSGRDHERLFALGRSLEAEIAAIDGAYDVHQSWENRIVKAVVEVDQVRARRAGVTSRDVAHALETMFAAQPVTGFLGDDIVIPIAVRGTAEERTSLARLRTVSVHSAETGRNVPLLQVADVVPAVDFGRIDRRNQSPTLTIAAKHRSLTAAEFEELILERVGERLGDLPQGFTFEWGGETEAAADAQEELFGYVPLALLGIAALLIWQFNSFRRGLIMAACIPLAVAAATFGLFVSGSWFGFMAILGFLSLAGIVVNYAILIIDRIEVERRAGKSVHDAVIAGAKLRLRAILMMSLTTVFGLLPLIVGRDVLFYDMANAIAFGIGGGMLLTLIAVPVLYHLALRDRSDE
ncbi:MAG: efflux RND transporter permease subunit [Geminicoccaceae bacterium]|nr:MAG: efflux RND transporter permease subunit [Geminicoccaceae bacterium]